ncbi:hypothetical protein SAMN06296065_107122 [Novosphingobium panipatense]|uniref:Lipoprotein n=2 Tax=Novosphingobium panipatense TaxID=428991 RepID=A0ABY1QLW5_9SPHN|nr:hypothetical protein SAMN06296065_107122 [Novosphingobium panipatense]
MHILGSMKTTGLLLAPALALAGCTLIPPADPSRIGAAPVAQPVPAYTPAPVYTPPADYNPVPPPAVQDRLIYAALGQTVAVDGPRLTPLQVLEDSRCPMNARCVWAGQVRLRIRIETGTGGELELTSGKPARVADGTLELVRTSPDKMTGSGSGAIDPAAYRFGFRFVGGY